jgi:hypothetical protein
VLLVSSGCGPAIGVRDEVTGLVGVPVSAGALAGTWGLAVDFETLVTAPVLGEQPARFQETYAVRRTFGEAGYADELVRCTRTSAAVAGTKMVVPQETFPKLGVERARPSVSHAEGLFAMPDVVELWGLAALPDPASTPLPTHANYAVAPQREWLLDEDGDGQPALTEQSQGSITGTVYAVVRVVWALDGTVLSTDRVQGLARLRANQVNRLEASSALLVGEAVTREDASRTSWFDAARLPDGAGCDEVAQAVSDGRLATKRPF